MAKRERIVYYPVYIEEERNKDAIDWVKNYLIPAGRVALNEKKANAYLVIGGDGHFMQACRERDPGKIFFGLNRGTFGFLLNPVSGINEIPEYFDELRTVTVNLIQGEFIPRKGRSRRFLAFNDIYCGAGVSDYITFSIEGELSYFPNRPNVSGNGLAVSTPQGTTAYALNNRGSSALKPLDSSDWYISGMSTGVYPADTVSPQKISIEVVNSRGARVDAFADSKSQCVRGIKKIIIRPTKHKVTISFLKNNDFAARRTALAQQKERE